METAASAGSCWLRGSQVPEEKKGAGKDVRSDVLLHIVFGKEVELLLGFKIPGR